MLQPLVAALAAGNTVCLKFSEICPAIAALMPVLIAKYFPKDIVTVGILVIPFRFTGFCFSIVLVFVIVQRYPRHVLLGGDLGRHQREI